MPCAPAAPGKLLAVSDLHVSYPQNRQWVEDLPPGSPNDWLLVVGDVAEKVADIEWTLRTLAAGSALWCGCPATMTCGLIPPTRSSCAARNATSTWWRCAATSA